MDAPQPMPLWNTTVSHVSPMLTYVPGALWTETTSAMGDPDAVSALQHWP